MKDSERKQFAMWIETWKHAGAAMEEVRRRELREYDYAVNQAVVDEMLQWAVENGQVRLSSGLIEQQQIFMEMAILHRRKNSDRITG